MTPVKAGYDPVSQILNDRKVSLGKRCAKGTVHFVFPGSPGLAYLQNLFVPSTPNVPGLRCGSLGSSERGFVQLDT